MQLSKDGDTREKPHWTGLCTASSLPRRPAWGPWRYSLAPYLLKKTTTWSVCLDRQPGSWTTVVSSRSEALVHAAARAEALLECFCFGRHVLRLPERETVLQHALPLYWHPVVSKVRPFPALQPYWPAPDWPGLAGCACQVQQNGRNLWESHNAAEIVPEAVWHHHS